jgi:hypothetical protein
MSKFEIPEQLFDLINNEYHGSSNNNSNNYECEVYFRLTKLEYEFILNLFQKNSQRELSQLKKSENWLVAEPPFEWKENLCYNYNKPNAGIRCSRNLLNNDTNETKNIIKEKIAVFPFTVTSDNGKTSKEVKCSIKKESELKDMMFLADVERKPNSSRLIERHIFLHPNLWAEVCISKIKQTDLDRIQTEILYEFEIELKTEERKIKEISAEEEALFFIKTIKHVLNCLE